MADFDEELKRQAAISSLLAQQPESQPLDTRTDEQVVPQPEVIKPDTQADYHRLINQAFDTKTDEQVTAQPDTTVYPTIAQDQGQPDKKFDTAVAESVVPYGERAAPEAPKSDYAPKDTGKGAAPEDYPTIAQDQGAGEGSGQHVERATLVKFPDGTPATMPWNRGVSPDPTKGNLGDEGLSAQILAQAKPDLSATTGFAVADPDPVNPDYKTPLSPNDELKFQAWVKANKVPFDDSATSDYDMRGFWKAAQEGDPDASTAVSKFDGKIHFNDKFKTPFHKTFSNESQYATADAPHWAGDRLIDNQGNVVVDETPPKKGKSVPGFVESSQNAIVNPAAGVVPPTITYPTIAEDQGAPGTPPKVQQAQPVEAVKGGQGFFGGDLTQGPPGTKPDGTENEPYWPKSNKDIALLPPGANYIDPKDQSQKVTPGAPASATTRAPNAPVAQTSPTPLPNAPVAQTSPTPLPNAPVDQLAVQPTTTEEYNKLVDSWFPSADSKAKANVQSGSTINPDGTPFPTELAPNGQQPAALVIHHTGGRGSPASVVEDWRTNRPGVGSQFIMDRDGVVHDVQAEFGYGGTGHFLHSVIPGVSNHTAVGIEVIAKDDADMTPAQIESLKKFAGPGGPYSNVAVYGHSQVSPNDRDNEGVRGVAAINEARAAGPTGQTGEPGTTPIETLVRLDQSGVNVTHFGYEKPGEEGWDKDSANGNGKYVKNLIPGYDVALNSASAAMVGNPKPGETFTFAGREWRYGDAASEKLKDPRFDIFDPTGNALTGSMPVGRQVAAGAPAKDKMPWDDWPKLSPTDQAAAEKEGQDFQTQQVSVLDKLNQSTKSPKQFWEMLQNPIEGVTDSQRQAYADNWKQKATQSAVDFYSQKGTVAEQHVTPEDAFKKAMSDPGWEEYVGNVGRGLAGAVGQADIGIALAGKSIDRNRADGFMNLVHPDSTGEGRAAFLKNLTDIQDTRHRHDIFNEIYGSLPQNTKDAIGDPASILDSIDHLANPKDQADLNKAIATKKAWVDQQLAGDPSLRGAPGILGQTADWWTTGTGENLFNTVAALVPGGVGAVVRTSTLGAQMYSANMDRIAKEHPDWSSDKVSEEASRSAFMTLAPQEAVLAASHGLTAPLLKWAGALAEKPIVRFGIGGGVQVAAAGVGGALGQVGENVAENKSPLTNVPQAAGAAVVQSLPFAVHGGIGALGHEVAPVEHAVPAEPARTEPAPPEPAPSRPVTTSEMLGPDRPEAPPPRAFTPEQEAYNKWYPNEIAQGEDPLVIRGAERTTWTPQELSEIIQKFPSATPEQLQEILKTQSPTGLHLEGGFERSGGRWKSQPANLEVEQTRQMRVNQPPITPTELLTRRAPVDLNTAIARQRAAAALGGTPPPATSRTKSFPTPDHTAVYNDLVARGMDEARARDYVNQARGATQAEILADVQTQMRGRGEQPPPQPGNISGEEPGIQREANKSTAHGVIDELTKGVANQYAEERMKAGELDPIDPNTGLTTEALMARALKMRPQEVQDHINNFMENRGGDPRDHAAAVRSREAFLTDRNRALSLKADTNPHDVQARSEAAAARKALNDFYTKGGPISKMKELFHVHGKGLQGEPSIDLSTSGGLHDKFKRETGNSPPPSAEPRLKKAAERVRTTHSDEYKARDKVDKAIDKDGRKKIPSIDEVRDYVAKRMTEMPCRK